jgi:hypothetical protein
MLRSVNWRFAYFLAFCLKFVFLLFACINCGKTLSFFAWEDGGGGDVLVTPGSIIYSVCMTSSHISSELQNLSQLSRPYIPGGSLVQCPVLFSAARLSCVVSEAVPESLSPEAIDWSQTAEAITVL